MKTPTKLLATAGIVLAIAIGFGIAGYVMPKSGVVRGVAVTPAPVATSFSYGGIEGQTALNLLTAKANVQVKGSGANAFVTAINGRIADDTKKEFWAFYINGKQADVGAGS